MSIYNHKLYHGGLGSGRYPLGSGQRPYQHRGGFFKKARKQQTSKRILTDKEKELLINSGNPVQVNKYKHQLTTQELKWAIERVDKFNDIEEKARKKKQGKKATTKALNAMKQATNARNEYNKFKKVMSGDVLGSNKRNNNK